MKKKIILFAITMVSVAALLYGLVYLLGVADLGGHHPDSATSTTMYVLKRRILNYAKKNNKLPNSVEEIPFLKGFVNINTDYWGNKIELQIKNNTVTMISYGKDKMPGGSGDNLDIVGIFDAQTAGGAWADENDEGYPAWKKVPGLDEGRQIQK